MHHPNNLHSVPQPVVARYRDVDIRRYIGGDSAFANPTSTRFWKKTTLCVTSSGQPESATPH